MRSSSSLVAASHLRRHRRASVLLVALVAAAVALTLASVAGARRTDRVIPEFVAADAGADGYVAFITSDVGGGADPGLVAEEAEVAAVPGVVRTARFTNPPVVVSGPSVPTGSLRVQGWAAMEPGGTDMVSALHLVAGRHPDDARPDEVAIDEALARNASLVVGSKVGLQSFATDDGAATLDRPHGLVLPVTVVGIVRRPTDLRDPRDRRLVPDERAVHQEVYLTSAWWERTGGRTAGLNPMVGFEVAPGVDVHGVLRAFGDDPDAYPLDHNRFLEIDGTFVGVERSASVHSRSLQAFAALAALTGLFLVGQTLGRQVALESGDHPSLRALGMTGGQLWLVALWRTAPVAIAGAAIGAAGAVALSPLAPLPGSVARRADLHPGVSFDPLVILGGGAAAAALTLAVAALPAARAIQLSGRADRIDARPSPASRLARLGVPPAAVVGVRFALEPGRGTRAVPVRAAILTATVAVALLLGAVLFARSLAATRDDPHAFGVTWDIAAGSMGAPAEYDAGAVLVRAVPGVEAVSGLHSTALATPFGEIPAVMVRPEKGAVVPRITSGRAPGPGEVALGELTMREQGLRIGDDLEISDPTAGSATFRITGTVVLNTAGIDVSVPPGRGALFDWGALVGMRPEVAQYLAPEVFVVRTQPGRSAEVERRLRELFPTSTSSAPLEPLDLTNLGDAAALPTALGSLVAVLGLGTVAHAMVSSVRRRQRELAILTVLGFVPAQVRRTVIVQALVFGALALVVGVPVGIVLGRRAWGAVADQLGIPVEPVSALVPAAAVSAGFVAVLVLTALVPARLARRIPTAAALGDG